MKRFFILAFVAVLTTLSFYSCSSGETYADQLDAEKALIQSYIQRKNIHVLSQFPTGAWGPNDYVKTSSGLYFHLVDSGNVSAPALVNGDEVIPRFYEYRLENTSDSIRVRNWTDTDNPSPATFIYGQTTQFSAGFREAVGYMKYQDAEALIILPSKIGLYYSTSQEVIPYAYKLKIKFLQLN